LFYFEIKPSQNEKIPRKNKFTKSKKAKVVLIITHPTEAVSSSFMDKVIVIIDTCLVVSSLTREIKSGTREDETSKMNKELWDYICEVQASE